jgi:hypothetical protein
MTLATSLLLVIGQSPADRIVIAATWSGLVLIAAIVLIASSTRPHVRR